MSRPKNWQNLCLLMVISFDYGDHDITENQSNVKSLLGLTFSQNSYCCPTQVVEDSVVGANSLRYCHWKL